VGLLTGVAGEGGGFAIVPALELLAGLQDSWVGGSAGGWSGGLKTSEKLRLLGMLDGQGDENFDRDMSITKLAQNTAW
jgi:hypothetical protein